MERKLNLIWQKMEQYVKKGEVEYFFWQSLLKIYFIVLSKGAQTILKKRPNDLINNLKFLIGMSFQPLKLRRTHPNSNIIIDINFANNLKDCKHNF